jgi:hypothetical protein
MTLTSSRDPVPDLKTIDRIGLRMLGVSALQCRISHARWRGEESRAVELEQQAEVAAVQMGSIWQLHLWTVLDSATAYSHHGDLLGLRGSVTRADELVARHRGRLEAPLDALRADYHRARGDLDEAERLL